MAIYFYNGVGTEKQELQDVSLEKLASNPTAYQGRIYFNTTSSLLVFYGGSTTGWVTLDGTGNVDEVNYNSTQTVSTGDPISASTASDVVTIKSHSYGGDNLIGTVPWLLNSQSSKYLGGNGVFSIPTGNMTSWELDGDNNSPQTVSDTETVLILGETGLISTVASSGDVITVNHENIARSNATTTPTQLAEGDTFPTVLTVTSEDTGPPKDLGHISAIDVQTITVPSTTSNNTTYTIDADLINGNGGLKFFDNASTLISSTEFVSTSNVGSTSSLASLISIFLKATISIVDSLTVTSSSGFVQINGQLIATSGSHIFRDTLDVTGIANFGSVNIPVISKVYADYAQSGTGSAEQWVNKIYVDTAAQTSIVFQGSYAADGSQSVPTGTAIEKGFAYAVTAGGTGNGTPFSWSPALDEGDFIYANVTDPSSQSDWTQIQNNIGKASNSAYGIARYLDANGWDTTMTKGQPVLKTRGADSGGTATAMPSLTMGSDNFGLVDSISNENILITADITPASSQVNDFNTASETVYDDYSTAFTVGSGGATYTVTHNYGTRDVFVQVFDSNDNNVFCRVTRPTTSTVQVLFSSNVTALLPMTVLCNAMSLT
jgi:hypothetical protein